MQVVIIKSVHVKCFKQCVHSERSGDAENVGLVLHSREGLCQREDD